MDAVGNLIYWQGNKQRGENREAMTFIQRLNQGLKERVPYCQLFAEDSSSYQGVTAPVEEGGLGFDYKWDLGWMNDTLDFFMKTPEERKDCYHKLTFSMMYFYNEHFILPFSHDEVVHGKKTIVDKMYGSYEEKFAQARALYLYMYAHPGKKLNFMGNEIGQLREWHEYREQDWGLLHYPMHQSFEQFHQDLIHLYNSYDAFYQNDFNEHGFSWIDCNKEEQCLYVFKRVASSTLVFFFNFSHQPQSYHYQEEGSLTCIMNTNDTCYNGEGTRIDQINPYDHIVIPAYTGMAFVLQD